MVDQNLPADLVAFLRSGKPLKYDPEACEAGAVELLPLDKLKVEFFPMTPDSPDDPHAGEYGSYLVAGVSLLGSCDGYDPVGLLLWLPLDERYGTWDGEHGTLRVFRKNVSWTVIAKNAPRHINAQWEDEGSAPVTDLAPWERHPHNAEQLHQALPDGPEWYEATWLRRGIHQDGVQVRYPEELQIRIEHDGVQYKLSLSKKKPEKDAEWSVPQESTLPSDALAQLATQLDHGFWNQPQSAPGGPGGEIATHWSIRGYRPVIYKSLHRFYPENQASGDPVHELGKALARLCNSQRFDGE